MVHHDNAPYHTALSVKVFLTSKGIPVVPQPPPYSHDLSPCEFLLFLKLKNVLKGCHFGTLENIQKSVTDILKSNTSWRLPVLLAKVGTTSPLVCSCPRDNIEKYKYLKVFTFSYYNYTLMFITLKQWMTRFTAINL